MTVLIFLKRVCRRIADFATGIDEARLMAYRFDVLSHLTDAQLAERGLKREQIPQAVLDRRVHA